MSDTMKAWARNFRADGRGSLSQVAGAMVGATIPELETAFEKVADNTEESMSKVARDAYLLLVRYGAYETAKRIKKHFDFDNNTTTT